MGFTREELINTTRVESDRETIALALEELKHLVSDKAYTGETMLLNMGPQHPSTHGVLRLMMELDGEIVVNCVPDVGYLHTGIEKTMESKSYEKALVMTDRIDYLNTQGNNLVYSLAIEKLCDIDVPERAQVIRVMIAELQRIASHLVWLGTHILDLGATSVMLYTFREREQILDMLESVSGQRMMGSYIRPGGVWRDLTPEFMPMLRRFLDYFPQKIDDYEKLISANPLFIDRTKGIGYISPEQAIAWSMSGPLLRGSGVNYDVRKAFPYTSYETYDFDVPLGKNGDVYDRYKIRMEELRQSVRILNQAVERIDDAEGSFRSENRKFVPPPRSELGQSMEAVIHHFKLWTEGFKAPKGEVYVPVESPRGELGVYLVGDGTHKPWRVRFRTPSFVNLQSLQWMTKEYMISDVVGIIGSVDFTLGDCDR